MKLRDRQRIAKEFSANIRREVDTGYVVTLSFRQFKGKPISDSLAVKTGMFFLKRLAKRFFGKNPHEEYLRGYMFLEYQKNGSPHLHILVEDHPVFLRPSKNFVELVEKVCENLYTVDENLGLDVRVYYEESIEGYVLKSINTTQTDFEFVKPFGEDDFITKKHYRQKPEYQFEMCLGLG